MIRKGPLRLFLVIVFGGFAAYESAELILSGKLAALGLAALGVVACVVCLVILRDWRKGLYIFLGWLLAEDFVRKFTGNNMGVYFAKDGLVLILYLSFFIAWRAKKVQSFRPPFLIPFLLLFWLGLAQVFNPASTSIFYGILGMKIYFLYAPLILAGYALINSESELRRFFFLNCVLIAVIAGLGIAQSVIGPTFLNPAHLQQDIAELSTNYKVAPLTGELAYRPTSVFVSNGRFQDFLIVSWLISLGFGGYLILRRKRGRQLVFATIAIVAGASFMSSSRGVFMWNSGSGLVVASAFLWGAPWHQKEAVRTVRAIQRSLLVVGIALLILVNAFPAQFGARLDVYSQTLSPSSSKSELAYRAATYPWQNFILAFEHPHWILGYGIGTASLGVQYVARITHAIPMDIGVENGYGCILVELGIFGLGLWLLFGASICVAAWKIVKQLKGSPWLPIGFVIFWYAFLVMFPMGYTSLTAYQDFVMNAYLWILLGILFRIPSVTLTSEFAPGAVPENPRRHRMS